MNKPSKKIRITDKQRAFVEDVQKTFNPERSVANVYNWKDKHGVNANYGVVLNSAGVRALMNDSKVGLDDGFLLARLKKALNAHKHYFDSETKTTISVEDWQTQVKALELALKLKGYLSSQFNEEAEERYKQITVNFNLVKARDTNEVKKLLGDMPSITVRDAILSKKAVVEEKVSEEKNESQEIIDG